MGVMSGKLRIYPVGHGKQFGRIGKVGHIGCLLARKHGITLKTQYLGILDLGVPICPLYQPDGDLAVQFFSEGIKPVKDSRATL